MLCVMDFYKRCNAIVPLITSAILENKFEIAEYLLPFYKQAHLDGTYNYERVHY